MYKYKPTCTITTGSTSNSRTIGITDGYEEEKNLMTDSKHCQFETYDDVKIKGVCDACIYWKFKILKLIVISFSILDECFTV